jgi:hypothetical protein
MSYHSSVIERPILWFFQRLTEEQFDTIQKNLVRQSHREDKTRILCRFCKHPITSYENKMEVNGQHRYVFSNPSGTIFEIGCFSSADGCVNKDNPTSLYTWFKWHYWNFSLCSKCYTHLGWFYQSAMSKNSFYGLILENLEEET